MKNSIKFMTQAAMIAAIYVVLVFVFAPISFGPVQIRVAEALTILPLFTPAAVPGVFIGCLIGNLLSPGMIVIDIVFGSLATLLAAIISYKLRDNKYLVPIPPIVINMIVVPYVIKYGYGVPMPILLSALAVGAGQVISCYGLGFILIRVLERYKDQIFA
ncbi:MAG: QueT transporter family protein [Epulopiscium sp.]|nr:QueT transporter family protein [Candidatus Epulonipiscium sp.]